MQMCKCFASGAAPVSSDSISSRCRLAASRGVRLVSMNVLVVSVCLMTLAVWPAQGETSEVPSEDQDTVCVNSDRLGFEQLYVNAGRPEVPPGTCAHGMSAYRALNAAQSACLREYARHDNGRCYRVVGKPQDGRVKKHAYRIVYREGCQLGGLDKERKVADLDALEALDLCDEDGGCVDAWAPAPKAVVPGQVCVAGQVTDAGGTCRTLLALPAQTRRAPKQRGQ